MAPQNRKFHDIVDLDFLLLARGIEDARPLLDQRRRRRRIAADIPDEVLRLESLGLCLWPDPERRHIDRQHCVDQLRQDDGFEIGTLAKLVEVAPETVDLAVRPLASEVRSTRKLGDWSARSRTLANPTFAPTCT